MRSSRRYVIVPLSAFSLPAMTLGDVLFPVRDAHQRDAVLFLDGEADVVDDRSDILHLAQMLNTDQHDLTCPSAAALWGSGS